MEGGRTDLWCQHPAPSAPLTRCCAWEMPFLLVWTRLCRVSNPQQQWADRTRWHPSSYEPQGLGLSCSREVNPGAKWESEPGDIQTGHGALGARPAFAGILVFVFLFLTNRRFAVSKMKSQLPVGRCLNACGCLFLEEFACRNCFL